MRTRVLLAALVVVGVVPQGAIGAERTRPARLERPAAASQRASDIKVHAPNGVELEALKDLRPDDGSLAALLLRRHLRLTVPRALGGGGFISTAEVAEADDVSYGAYPLATTDVDGDGKQDVLLVQYTRVGEDWDAQSFTYQVVARAGVDGRPLWRTAEFGGEDNVYLRADDVEGDGTLDLIMFADGFPWPTYQLVHHEEYRFAQTTTLLDGRDGVARWSQVHDGAFTRSRVVDVSVEHATNLVWSIEPITSPFQTVDGALIIGTVDYRDGSTRRVHSPVEPRGVRAGARVCDTRTRVYEAYAGELLADWSTGARGDCMGHLALKDPHAGGHSDVLLFSQKEAELRPADGVGRIWRRDVGFDDAWGMVLPVALEDGGSADFIYLGTNAYIYTADSGIVIVIKTDHLAGFSGETGDVLFDRHVDVTFRFIGSADADGGDDFAEVALSFDDVGYYGLRAFSGRTGADLWQRELRLAQDGAGVRPTAAGDLDGDGSIDLVVVGWYDADGETHAVMQLWSGSDGTVVWLTETTDLSRVPNSVYGDGPRGYGDVNLDGRSDLVTWSVSAGGTWRATYRDGLSLEPLGSFEFEEDDREFVYLDGVYDLSSSPGRETLAIRDIYPRDAPSDAHVEAYDATGLMWRVRMSQDLAT